MEMNLINELLRELDACLECTSYEMDGDILRLFVKSARDEVVCPQCGKPSAKQHSKYQKKFRDLPVMGKKVEIVIENRVMVCGNPECSKSRFAERFESIKPYERKTERLWKKIDDVALNTSAVQASATLRDGIADVCKSTLCEREKQPPPLVDPKSLIAIGIDDWAKRKRESYGTIIVDMENRRVVDLIDGRDKETVALHLAQYKNVIAVNRDGSQSYRAAITEALPNAVQISDYFHLLKGLTDALKPYLTHSLPGTITVASDKSISPRWISTCPENARERKSREKEEAKMDRHRKILEMTDQGYTVHQTAIELGISEQTVRNNLKPDYSPADARKGSSNGRGEIARYAGKVCSLYEHGLPMTKILDEIKKEGFSGGYFAVQNYIAREKRRRTAAAVHGGQVVIERKKALAMMYNRKKAPLSEAEVNAISSEYPQYRVILDLVKSFRRLFADRDPEGLNEWLEQAAALDIPDLTSFVNGVRKDITAVSAGIVLGMTSGVVEGSVNKLKVAKRVMYGRCSFELLRGKLLRYEERKAFRQRAKATA